MTVLGNTIALVALCMCAALGVCLLFMHNDQYRLPTAVQPLNYSITLRPYLLEEDADRRFTFDGDVEIEIVSSVPTSIIVLHTKNLKYVKREYWHKHSPHHRIALNRFIYNYATDRIVYILPGHICRGEVIILHFVYTGSMENNMGGFYSSSYIDGENITRWFAATQLELTYARLVFPSFDEPNFKANFTMTIIRPKHMNSFSNTRAISTTFDGDYATDVYGQTPKMPAYTVAAIVADFSVRSNGMFGVIARPEYYAKTDYCFETGPKILEQLDDYLNMSYYKMGVDKMHIAALPSFNITGMENWGLVTFKENAMLYERGLNTLFTKQNVAVNVAHELSHMWFGNLVSCEWWSYTWLKEGFARYFGYSAAAKVEPGLELPKQFVVDQIHILMIFDSTAFSHPLSINEGNSRTEFIRFYDIISYRKGATFIRMVKHVMDGPRFQKSLRQYLKKYAYKNTVPQNLFDSWKRNWPTEFRAYADALFKSFTEQTGYPLVKISVSCNGRSFKISQKRFLLRDNDGADKSLLYTVPITYTTDKENDFASTKPKFFLEATKNKRIVNLNTNVNWVIANIQETGYYRVNYDTKNWHNIYAALSKNNFSTIGDVNRAQIVDDLFNLAHSGEIEYDLALKVLEYLETETHYVPWTAAFNGYSYLSIHLGTDTKNFGIYIRQLTEKTYKLLGFDERASDTPLEIYNRAKILSWSCKYRNSDCIEKSNNYFQKWLKFNTPVPVNIRSAVYCSAIREGKENEFNALLQKYKTTNEPTERALILSSLGCVKIETLVSKFFWFIVSDEVRRLDKSSALSSLYSENNENVSPVFKLVTENHKKLAKSMDGYSAVATVISNIATRFTTETQLKDLKAFNVNNTSKFGSSAAVLKAAEKTVADNLVWANKNMGAFKRYLCKRTLNLVFE